MNLRSSKKASLSKESDDFDDRTRAGGGAGGRSRRVTGGSTVSKARTKDVDMNDPKPSKSIKTKAIKAKAPTTTRKKVAPVSKISKTKNKTVKENQTNGKDCVDCIPNPKGKKGAVSGKIEKVTKSTKSTRSLKSTKSEKSNKSKPCPPGYSRKNGVCLRDVLPKNPMTVQSIVDHSDSYHAVIAKKGKTIAHHPKNEALETNPKLTKQVHEALDKTWEKEHEFMDNISKKIPMSKKEKTYLNKTIPIVINSIASNPKTLKDLTDATQKISTGSVKVESKSWTQKLTSWIAPIGHKLMSVLNYALPAVKWLLSHPIAMLIVSYCLLSLKRKICGLIKDKTIVLKKDYRGVSETIIATASSIYGWFKGAVTYVVPQIVQDVTSVMYSIVTNPYVTALVGAIAALMVYATLQVYLGEDVTKLLMNVSAGFSAMYILSEVIMGDCVGETVHENEKEFSARKVKEDADIVNNTSDGQARNSSAMDMLNQFKADTKQHQTFSQDLLQTDKSKYDHWHEVKKDLTHKMQNGHKLSSNELSLFEKLNVWSTSMCNWHGPGSKECLASRAKFPNYS